MSSFLADHDGNHFGSSRVCRADTTQQQTNISLLETSEVRGKIPWTDYGVPPTDYGPQGILVLVKYCLCAHPIQKIPLRRNVPRFFGFFCAHLPRSHNWAKWRSCRRHSSPLRTCYTTIRLYFVWYTCWELLWRCERVMGTILGEESDRWRCLKNTFHWSQWRSFWILKAYTNETDTTTNKLIIEWEDDAAILQEAEVVASQTDDGSSRAKHGHQTKGAFRIDWLSSQQK